MPSPRSGTRFARVFGAAALAAALSLPLGWVISDRLEQDNDFCNSCHLSSGTPLHIDIRRDFDLTPPQTLAGLHGGSDSGREDAAFRCIDCHGGASLIGRARVKALAGLDLLWYVVGRFEEPSQMAWPLWDEDCSQCHPTFDSVASLAWETPRFHELPVHNVDLGVDCVECHRSHQAGNPEAHFLEVSSVRSQCARCHLEFKEESR